MSYGVGGESIDRMRGLCESQAPREGFLEEGLKLHSGGQARS